MTTLIGPKWAHKQQIHILSEVSCLSKKTGGFQECEQACGHWCLGGALGDCIPFPWSIGCLMWSSSSHIARGHWANTQAPAVGPIRTKQRPNQHECAAPTTVSSAWRDSSEPQSTPRQPAADGRTCDRECGERQAYEVARQHPCQTLAGTGELRRRSTKHRV